MTEGLCGEEPETDKGLSLAKVFELNLAPKLGAFLNEEWPGTDAELRLAPDYEPGLSETEQNWKPEFVKGLSECELNRAPEFETVLSEDWPGETARLSLATTGLNDAELNMSPELETVRIGQEKLRD